MPGFGDRGTGVGSLVPRSPQRGSDRHGQALSVAVLPAPGFAGDLVFFSQPRVEYPAKLHIACMAACRDDDALACPDVEILVFESCSDSKDSSCGRFFPDEGRQLVPQKEIDAFGSRACFQRPDDPGTACARNRFVQVIGEHLTDEESRNGSTRNARIRTAQNSGSGINKFDAIFEQELERRSVFVSPNANKVPVAMPVLRIHMVGMVQIDLVCRIGYSVLLLQTGTATKGDVSSAYHGVSADIVVLFDRDYGCTVITCRNRGAKPRSSSPGNHHIGLPVPSQPALGAGFLRLESSQGRCAETKRCAFFNESSPGNGRLFVLLVHRLLLVFGWLPYPTLALLRNRFVFTPIRR